MPVAELWKYFVKVEMEPKKFKPKNTGFSIVLIIVLCVFIYIEEYIKSALGVNI